MNTADADLRTILEKPYNPQIIGALGAAVYARMGG